MKSIRVYDSVEEAQAARERLEAHRDSKATAELISPGDSGAEALLQRAGLAEDEASGALGHLQAGRVVLVIQHGLLDGMRLNDLLGPNHPADSKAWTPGVGHLEDEVGKPGPKRSEL